MKGWGKFIAVITCPIYNLFQWYSCFKDYQDDLNDNRWLDQSANSHGWSLQTVMNSSKKVCELIAIVSNVTLKLMAEGFGINKDQILKILTKNLAKWKICTLFVPHINWWSRTHLEHYKDIIKTAQRNKILDSMVTSDEMWYFQYDPSINWQRAKWKSPSSARLKKFHFQKSQIRIMLICFYDSTILFIRNLFQGSNSYWQILFGCFGEFVEKNYIYKTQIQWDWKLVSLAWQCTSTLKTSMFSIIHIIL